MSKATLVLILVSALPNFVRAQKDAAAGPVLRLSLGRAVEMALSPEGNQRVQLAQEAVRQAEARSGQARAALLPNVEASFGAQSKTLSLGVLGLQTLPGFSFPVFVGPFSVWDARASFSQSILDFSSTQRLRASRVGVDVAKAEDDSTRDQVAAQVARLYITALRADATLETAKANRTLAEALLRLANDRLETGVGTGIEATRAQVQLANEQQRVLAAETERRRAHLQLLKALNLKLDAALELSDKLAVVPVAVFTPEQAVALARESRADLKARDRRREHARLDYSAVQRERLPSLVGFADYGAFGSGIDRALPTRTYGISVRLPVFDGGRREARQSENLSLLREEEIRRKDLQGQVELEVRQALDNLRSSEQQVKVAEEGLGLAENELAQARRRYEAGLANSLEVTDAQTRLARARDNHTAALFSYNLARIDLGEAMGTIRSMIQTTP